MDARPASCVASCTRNRFCRRCRPSLGRRSMHRVSEHRGSGAGGWDTGKSCSLREQSRVPTQLRIACDSFSASLQCLRLCSLLDSPPSWCLSLRSRMATKGVAMARATHQRDFAKLLRAGGFILLLCSLSVSRPFYFLFALRYCSFSFSLRTCPSVPCSFLFFPLPFLPVAFPSLPFLPSPVMCLHSPMYFFFLPHISCFSLAFLFCSILCLACSFDFVDFPVFFFFFIQSACSCLSFSLSFLC